MVTTLMARGAFPDSHPLHMGMPGMHGTVAAVGALQKSDLVLALGARFDDRVTGRLDTFAPDAVVDSRRHRPGGDLQEPHRRCADRGRRAEVIIDLIAALQTEHRQDALATTRLGSTPCNGCAPPTLLATPRQTTVRSPRNTSSPDWENSPATTRCSPQALGSTRCGPRSTSATSGRGTWLNSGGLGTMGFAVPAAMGAKVGRPEATVWAIDGDGCFQMTNQELATCAINDIPIKVAVINNNSLGMVRQWQTLFYESRYSNTDLHSVRIPDFAKLAEAYGCAGLRCESATEVDATIEKAMAIDDRPVVVDFVVHKDAMVWPMVAAGTSNDDIKIARDMAPQWDKDEL